MSEVLHVIMLVVKGQVAVIMLLVLLEVLVMVVKEFVVEEVLLFSRSSTINPRTTPSTRPAGRCLGLGG